MTALIMNIFLLSMSAAETIGHEPENPCNEIECPDNGKCTVIEGEPVCVSFELVNEGEEAVQETAIEIKKPASVEAPKKESSIQHECVRNYHCPDPLVCYNGTCISKAKVKRSVYEPDQPEEIDVEIEVRGNKVFLGGAIMGGILYSCQAGMGWYIIDAGSPLNLAAGNFTLNLAAGNFTTMALAAQTMAMEQLEEMGSSPSKHMRRLNTAGWIFHILSTLSVFGLLGVTIEAKVNPDNDGYGLYLGLMYGVSAPLTLVTGLIMFAGWHRLKKEINKTYSGWLVSSSVKSPAAVSPYVSPLQGGAAAGISGVF